MQDFDSWVAARERESPRSSRRRYTLWTLFIIAVFTFCLGIIAGAYI